MKGDPFDRFDEIEDPLAYLPEDVEPDDLAYGFHVEELPEEDEDGYVEVRP